MRPVVSYEDITLPYGVTANVSEAVSRLNDSGPASVKPTSKKRKKSRAQNNVGVRTKTLEEDDGDYLQVEENRELTHEEIWDDSALIEAWNAATEEYEAYNGPDKGWKDEPTKTSNLVNGGPRAHENEEADEEEDSQPIDFNTFVPSHNPELDLPVPEQTPAIPGPDFSAFYSNMLPELSEPMVSQDEAFTRALGAMYWGGYWTAVYHCHRQMQIKKRFAEDDEDQDEEDEMGVNDENDESYAEQAPSEDFVSTQR
ncbi:hypothetical protein D9758_007340 [Tetrapyrgos nigripes]|uniref:Survival Motor Neuron Gemin2-binding domain-containing protein n=1 Tax=Tetrapyrgos nigripes TaxID=182062 RepID=A0A8H5GBJ5_9AGAR|nr:hypothetical protein D9758_007340 [Tetrapyrgos nigripes]